MGYEVGQIQDSIWKGILGVRPQSVFSNRLIYALLTADAWVVVAEVGLEANRLGGEEEDIT